MIREVGHMSRVRVPMTVIGAQKLREELDQLKYKERPEVIGAISEARAHGDLKENAEYHAAKERQSFLEGRISEIESKLSFAQIIDIATLPHTGKVVFGCTVMLHNLETGVEVKYQIVGDDESNLKEAKISVNSPIARAIIGKTEKEIVFVNTPSGEIEYKITKVIYTT